MRAMISRSLDILDVLDGYYADEPSTVPRVIEDLIAPTLMLWRRYRRTDADGCVWSTCRDVRAIRGELRTQKVRRWLRARVG